MLGDGGDFLFVCFFHIFFYFKKIFSILLYVALGGYGCWFIS